MSELAEIADITIERVPLEQRNEFNDPFRISYPGTGWVATDFELQEFAAQLDELIEAERLHRSRNQ